MQRRAFRQVLLSEIWINRRNQGCAYRLLCMDALWKKKIVRIILNSALSEETESAENLASAIRKRFKPNGWCEPS